MAYDRLAGWLCSTFALFVLGVLAPTANAADPEVSYLDPNGGQRGTEIDLTIRGNRLEDAQGLVFDEPGLRVVSVEPKDAKTLNVRLAIESECRLGIHGVWVRTESGVSNVTTFHVGSLPEVAEQEPNSEFDAPQAVALGHVINGKVLTEDVDYFQVEAKKGQRISVEIEALRIGRTFFDPYIAILDANRFELARSDDSALLVQDGVCSVIAPEDGKYVIEVRESAFGGNGACVYRLHVGSFPRPTAVYPAGGRPGETLAVRWLGDPAGERTEEITLPSNPGPKFALFAKDEHGEAPSGNAFRVSPLENVLESEPNNSAGEATPAAAPGALNGIISEPGDTDYFKFSAKKGQQFDIRVYARELRSPLDSVISVRRIGGGNVGSNDDSGSPDSYYRFRAPEDDEYVVAIYDHLRAGGDDYIYRIEITPVKPELTFSLPERDRYVAMRAAIPRGGRTAVMVNARRQNFGGALQLDLRDLPEGVSFQSEEMADNRNEIPVLLEAKADAPLADSLVDITGKATDEKVSVEGHLAQRHMLVRGQNNRDVWGYNTERMVTAVTKEVPFEIEIVQPKVPLVQGGSMELKVVAKRKEGYTAAIPIQMLYNPPGVSSSASKSIPEGKNEAVIPLTAAGNAQIRHWKIVVLARANHNGRVDVASQMADLEVAAPYVGLSFQKAAVEQGQECELIVEVEKLKDFEGEADVQLVGLPPGTSTEQQKITKDTKQIVYKIKTDADAREGRHKSLLCRVTVVESGEPILHTIGSGELRVDKPLPPKKDEPAKTAAKPKPKPEPAKDKPKPLSRLEQLRQQREAAKAAAGN